MKRRKMDNHMVTTLFLKHPFTMFVAGPTGCGKTQFVKKIIEKSSISSHPSPKSIHYFYGEWQPIFNHMNNVIFHHGLNDQIEKIGSSGAPEWIIIDDLMNESSNNKLISDIFTKGSHHRNISIILILQNFFTRGKEMRNITLNSQYLVLFKNPRDQSLATNIAKQMYPHRCIWFQKIYEDATSQPFSYLFIDLKPSTPNNLRLLTNILGEQKYVTVYV